MKPLHIFACTSILLSLNVSHAYERERALVNLASDYSECAAFYLIAAEAEESIEKKEAAEKFRQIGASAIEMAMMLSNPDVTGARVKLAMKEQMAKIQNDFSNLAILILDYGDMCQQAMTQPDNRMQYWLDMK